MRTLYNEQQIYDAEDQIEATYREAGREPDATRGAVWIARMRFDAAYLPWAGAVQKHLDTPGGLRDSLGLPLTGTPPSGWESGALSISGRHFYDPSGARWLYAGYTIHQLPTLVAQGVDVQPLLTQAIQYGANAVVMICTHLSDWKASHGFHLDPRDPAWPDILRQTFRLVVDRGLRPSPACLADCQHDPQHGFSGPGLTVAEQQRAWALFSEVVSEFPEALPRVGNEWTQNGWYPGDFPSPAGPICSRGSVQGDKPPYYPIVPFGWCEFEIRRDKPKAFADTPLVELQAGYTEFPSGTNCPTVHTEPALFAQSSPDENGDDRWTDPDDALTLGALMGRTTSGGAFGSTSSLDGRLNQPNEDACASAFFRGLWGSFER